MTYNNSDNMNDRWIIEENGISWQVAKGGIPHYDDLEMSGRGISYVIKYGVCEDGSLSLDRHSIWPALRRIPNDTYGSFQDSIKKEFMPLFSVNGENITEYPEKFHIGEYITIFSNTDNNIKIKRQCFPSTIHKNAYEIITLTNNSTETINMDITGEDGVNSTGRGNKGVYLVESHWKTGNQSVSLIAGENFKINVCISARTADKEWEYADVDAELVKRCERVAELVEPLKLETDDIILDTLFRFAKIRAGESIFDTMAGPIHSPGGYSYYAATWCNDQIEYAGPWFAYTGDKLAMYASINAYMQYRPFMGPFYTPIPSSIICEGNDFWEGAGDRGDASMYAYGTSLFVILSGKLDLAWKLWTGIEWCLEYCKRQMNKAGVIRSDSDELEERFPSGNANLSTSCLYYGGLVNAAIVARALGKNEIAREYEILAQKMLVSIEKYFGDTLKGFDTYRYYDGNTELRSWICLPLCMGIDNRKKGTMDALLSEHLWTKDGLLTCENTGTVWDRSTLYGLKGGFISGYGDKVIGYLKDYSRNRLLGERVPYAFEAYPEGGKRHLSGESALYCRTIVEGLIGIKPTGMNCFEITPRLSSGMGYIKLKNIKAFDSCFDIEILPDGAKVVADGNVVWSGKLGEKATVIL